MSKRDKERAPDHGQTGRQLSTRLSGKLSTADMSTGSVSSESGEREQSLPGATVLEIHELDKEHVIDSFHISVYSISGNTKLPMAVFNTNISKPEWHHFRTLPEFVCMCESFKQKQMQLVDETTQETQVKVHIDVHDKCKSNTIDTILREFGNVPSHMSTLHFHVAKPMVDDVMSRLKKSKFHRQGHGSVHHTPPTTLTIVASVNHDDEVFTEARNIVFYAKMEKIADSMNVENRSTISRSTTEPKPSNEGRPPKQLQKEAAVISPRNSEPETLRALFISPSLNQYLHQSEKARKLVIDQFAEKQMTCSFEHESCQIIVSAKEENDLKDLDTFLHTIIREEVVEIEHSTALQVYGIDETISIIQEHIKDPAELSCFPVKEKITLIGTISGIEKAKNVLEELRKGLTELHLFVGDLSTTMLDNFQKKIDVIQRKYGCIFMKRSPPYVKMAGRAKAVEKFKELVAGCLKEETFEMKAEAKALLKSSEEAEHFLVKQAEQEYLEVRFDLEKALYIVTHPGESTFDPMVLTTWYKTKSFMVNRYLVNKSEESIRQILAKSEDVDDSKVLVVLEGKRLTLTATADEYPKAERVIEDIRLGKFGENRAEVQTRDKSGHDGKNEHVEETDLIAANDAQRETRVARNINHNTKREISHVETYQEMKNNADKIGASKVELEVKHNKHTREDVSLVVDELKETFLQCPVCLLTFDHEDKRPRLLLCLHTFCSECLIHLLAKEGMGQITCPLCRCLQKVKGDIQSLPVDPVRDKLVDYVQLKNKKLILCTECEDSETAMSRCQDCQSYLCKDCNHEHRRYKVSRHHKLISLDEVLDQPIRTLSALHFCPKHQKYHLEFYCKTDEQLCCVSCTVLDHKGHDLVALEAANVEKRTEVEKLMKDAMTKAENMRSAKQELTTHHQQILFTKAKSLADIDAVFEAIKQDLDQRRCSLVAALEDKTNNMVSSIEKRTNALDQTLAVIESTNTYYTEAKEKADVVELLKLYPTFKRNVEGIEDPTPLTSLGHKIPSLSFVGRGAKEARDALNIVGDFEANTTDEGLG